ncbi:threonine--tRNA ligase [Candidatus Uabimicrobium amorphum]|uniref:Threonine--tRNA ligase n=1 Tax=Uabimicrobium amorphum TaxID=2596890 RepID=A0A5S9IJU1_UABAM|nr:threonine--tRNA ligase [Candidatus Uabimicrobium amorphum]BBM82786.1 threonine--tRNA ligase [Candidatus Uabimicrobium amorphum]
MKAAEKTQEYKNSHIYRLRHSLAHIMAQAVLQIRPDAKLGFGPPVDNGFYYDFDFGDSPISDSDFKDIEKRMKKIVKQKQVFEASQKSLDETLQLLEETNQEYKIEYAKELVETGKAEGGQLGFYVNGPFIDMCEGPHLEDTGKVPKACFKLDKIAGSYWRGDEKRPMLTRIYALAFENVDELKDYIQRRELAKKREHRKLGAELDLFVIDDEVGVGLPMWLPNGTIIRDELEKWAHEVEFKAGYKRVSTPCITRSNLYHRSGHLPYYTEGMFPPMVIDDHDEYYLRPMNCPHHHKLYMSRPRSYRDLPIRLAEYGDVYRYEKHGSLAGILRVRAMSMNDAHIYCEQDQVKEEFTKVMQMYRFYYDHLRLGNFRVRLSLHDKDSEKFVDSEEEWVESENIVREVLRENNIDFDEEVGEAAFYGPKVDIQLSNVMGREETVSTCQLDFVMPERFDLEYTDRNGESQRPFILHRAPLSTHERMIAFLIELYGGAFPTWMSPVQVLIIPVNETVHEYAKQIESRLFDNMLRVETDLSGDTFNKKIRRGVTRKIPNIWIIGNNEMEEQAITWRRYCVKDQVKLNIDKACANLIRWRDERIMDNFDDIVIDE